MILKFFGADKEVTGSCHCLEVNGKRILLDCGMQQGKDDEGDENRVLPFSADSIDAVVLSHAHIDHSGRLPMLVKMGYKGPIYATRLTCELLEIMLADSAHIQETEAEWKKKKQIRAGKEPEEALYTQKDVEETLKYLVPCEYHKEIILFDGIKMELSDAGHLLGSASFLFTLEENGVRKELVFSGDIGNYDQPIIRDPERYERADYIIMESTYGDRLHTKADDLVKELATVLNRTFERDGNVVIPAFAVGRTQELLYFIREIKARRLVTSMPDFPVYVDSPLAKEITEIYDGDLTGYADPETIAVLKKGYHPISFSNLYLCKTKEESMALNQNNCPKVIISSSGMCDAGRIRHHLKHNLWKEGSAVVFVGFQAKGSLGRRLLDGVKQVKMFGEMIAVNASVYNFRGMSGHADKEGLLDWICAFQKKVEKVFVVHGEDEICEGFAQEITDLGYPAVAPNFMAEYDLIANEWISVGVAKGKEKPVTQPKDAYEILEEAGICLLSVIRQKKDESKEKLREFAEQILSLINKWK